MKRIIDNDLFQKLIDAHKSADTIDDSYLYMLLKNEELFQELIKNNKLNEDDTRYLLNKIDKSYEIANLFTNAPLTKYVLNEFILNEELIDKFNALVEKEHWYRSTNKEIRFVCIDNVFDSIKFYTTHKFDYIKREWYEKFEDKIDQELLELNELNRYLNIFSITKEQRLEIFEILRDNEIARKSLIQIVENQLENNYDFESLMMYLKKKEKRNLLNI